MAFQLPGTPSFGQTVLNTASMEYFIWNFVDGTTGYVWAKNPQHF